MAPAFSFALPLVPIAGTVRVAVRANANGGASLRDRAHGTFDAEEDQAQTLAAFWSAFSFLSPVDPASLDKGAPARADFLLLLRTRPEEIDLLCLTPTSGCPGPTGPPWHA